MCRIYDREDYSKEALAEMSVLGERGGMEDRRGPEIANGTKVVSWFQFIVALLALLAGAVAFALRVEREMGMNQQYRMDAPILMREHLEDEFVGREVFEVRMDNFEENQKKILERLEEIRKKG